MNEPSSYLADRAAERRWRLITGLVAAAALVASALWILSQSTEPRVASVASSVPSETNSTATATTAAPQRGAL